jgi:hypothetical protein
MSWRGLYTVLLIRSVERVASGWQNHLNSLGAQRIDLSKPASTERFDHGHQGARTKLLVLIMLLGNLTFFAHRSWKERIANQESRRARGLFDFFVVRDLRKQDAMSIACQ